jgi:SAM-dependent methyltransferase
MSGFSADWLALREPFDRKARNESILKAVGHAFAQHGAINVVDLACGTGSTLRALGPYLPSRQSWRLYDNDLSLLARIAPAQNVKVVPLDLKRDLEAALDGAVDLVTTSALLDLVSGEWLERLAVETAARRVPVYAALSYDGRAELDPFDELDARVVASVNAHQRRDKGFGPALGPVAASVAADWFRKVGYDVATGESDWVFGPQDREIQTETLSGWATAAREMGDIPLDEVLGWLTRRREAVAAGQSSIRVGHADLFAWPKPPGAR